MPLTSNPLHAYPGWEQFLPRPSYLNDSGWTPSEYHNSIVNGRVGRLDVLDGFSRDGGREERPQGYVAPRAPRTDVNEGRAEEEVGQRLYAWAARKLSPDVVERLKEQFSSPEGSECPVCLETPADNDLGIFSCGHGMCMSCVQRNIDAHPEKLRAARTCPHCRFVFDERKATTKKYFLQVHCPPQSVQPGPIPVADEDGDVSMSDD